MNAVIVSRRGFFRKPTVDDAIIVLESTVVFLVYVVIRLLMLGVWT